MLKFKFYFLTGLFSFLILHSPFTQSWIRINQLDYLPSQIKVAVLLSKEEISPKSFHIWVVLTDEIVYSSKK